MSRPGEAGGLAAPGVAGVHMERDPGTAARSAALPPISAGGAGGGVWSLVWEIWQSWP